MMNESENNMEQLIEIAKMHQEVRKASTEVWRIRQQADRFLMERGVGHYCNVTVNKRGHWFELEGTIDSQWSRAVLFSLVPSDGGKRYIVDRLQIVDEPLGRSNWA
jgi:hypothetical protein